MKHTLDNSVLLITGGTGSFGKAVLRRFLETNVKEIRIFSRDEKKQEELRATHSNEKIKFYIGDVRDPRSVSSAVKGVDYIFHAAALKQVPSCEFYPIEALKTNVLGTENVIDAAVNASVKKMICLSTDKAVYPINAMGMTKALMEKVLIAKSRNSEGTILCGTRYGNVMASRGSVIPLFARQIQNGHALNITDPNMTRFMMSLDEAVDLVMFAFEEGQNGSIYVQKSPAATIDLLATTMIELLGGDQSARTVIGTRHGEKLYEVLLSREEMASATDLGTYYCIPCDNRSLNYSKYISSGQITISDQQDYNSHNTYRLNKEELMHKLQNIELFNRLEK